MQISKFFATRPLAISYPSPPTFGVLCCNVCSLITWITCWKPIVNLQDSTCPWATRHSNLFSRLSLLCVVWSLEARLWLWPVIWKPRIWVVKNMSCWRGERVSRLLLWQNLWVSKPQAVTKNYLLYQSLTWSMKNATLFLSCPNFRTLNSFTKKCSSWLELKLFDS